MNEDLKTKKSKAGSSPKLGQKDRVPKEPFITWFAKQREFMRDQFVLEKAKKTSHGRSEFRNGDGNKDRSAFASHFDRRRFASWCGIDLNELELLERMMRKGENRKFIHIKLVDRVMSTLARPDLFVQWYPIEAFDKDGRWIGIPTEEDTDGS